MKNPEWPGIATAVAIILIAMIALDLSKWQTLAAALVAFGGAALAYRGAMAKVSHDQMIVDRDSMRRKLSLYLKLEFAFRELVDEAREKNAYITFDPLEGTAYIGEEHFRIEEPPELEEAWAYLDLFPREIIGEIRNTRNCLRKLRKLCIELGERQIAWGVGEKPHSMIEEAQALMHELWHSAAIVKDALDPEIKELAPDMDESERMVRIHGEPIFDED
ncbi:hypothetical protein [Bradyrhizobium sp. McL0616]|uniref:hypothetical protein n=1 Tax=Bradyrhizobium sp. McL0616 TaxID=3415674 RepID=UPI003CED4ABA